MIENGTEVHDMESVWTNIRQTQNQVSGMEAKLDIVIDGQTQTQRTINSILTKPQPVTDYKGIIVIALAVAGMAGALVAATIRPINNLVAKHDGQIMKELEESAGHRKAAGEILGKQQAMETILTEFINDTHRRLLAEEERSISSEARQGIIMNWLTAVDHLGSRKHAISAADAMKEAHKDTR